MTDLERCRAEQAECAEYLRGPGVDKRGAWAGLEDWLMEECIILGEQNDSTDSTAVVLW
jgi:hypothetical protein